MTHTGEEPPPIDRDTASRVRNAQDIDRRKTLAIGAMIAVGAGILMAVWWPNKEERLINRSNEEFRSGVANVPNVEPEEPPQYERKPPVDDWLRREALRHAREMERLKEVRRRSPMVIYDTGTLKSNVRNGEAGGKVATGYRLKNLDRLLAEGSIIPAVLETAIATDVPGRTRAAVTQDVWSFDGTQVLLPKGTRLVGRYHSNVRGGEVRVGVIWTRIIRSDGFAFELDSPGTDALGRSGQKGHVDSHFWERFGTSILLSLIGAGVAAAVDDDGNRLDEEVGGSFSRAAEIALRHSINIRPTIRVDQGERISVFVNQDFQVKD